MSLIANGSSLPASYSNLFTWLDGFFVNHNGTSISSFIDRALANPGGTWASAGCSWGATKFSNSTAPGWTQSAGSVTNLSITHGANATWFVVCSAPGANGRIISNATNARFSTASSKLVIRDDATGTVTGATNVPATGLCTLAATVNGANGTVYINGVSDGTAAGFALTGSIDGQGGTGLGDGTNTTAADFAEVMIFKSALSAGEILNLHRYAKNKWFNNTGG